MATDASSAPTVGVVTINDDRNFGNRLQNFALQEALASLGWRVETIRNSPPAMAKGLLAKRAGHAIRKDGPVTFARRNLALLRSRRGPGVSEAPSSDSRRTVAIARFAEERIRSSEAVFDQCPAAFWSDRYDRVVVGSDQVWNHGFRNAQEIDFLTFAPPEKRTAYAASFGVPEIPTFLQRRYRSWLAGIPNISVREDQGAKIVESLTGRTVPVVLDPTLLLDRNAWLRNLSIPKGWDDAYAVKFFLGTARPQQQAWVDDLASRRGVALVDLNDLSSDGVANLDPLDFVSVLSRADFVATDSFHAGAFSLLHERPVVVKSRDQTDARLHTLFDKHGIALEQTAVRGLSTALEPDWEAAADRLTAERDASWQFLRTALGAPATNGES